MSIYFFSFDEVHPLGDSATHPIEPLATRLGRKLLLAGRIPQRRRPCGAHHARGMACFKPSKRAQARLEPRLLPYPDAPPAAHSGASN